MRETFVATKSLQRVGEGASLRSCKPGDEVPEAAGWGEVWHRQGWVKKVSLPDSHPPPPGMKLVGTAVLPCPEAQVRWAREQQAAQQGPPAQELPAFMRQPATDDPKERALITEEAQDVGRPEVVHTETGQTVTPGRRKRGR